MSNKEEIFDELETFIPDPEAPEIPKEANKITDIRRKELNDLVNYGNSNFDKQVVYLAGGLLGLSVVFLKDIVDLKRANLVWMEIAWLFCVLVLCVNLASHQTSIRSANLELGHNIEKSNQMDTVTIILNYISITGIVIGIACFLLFIMTNLEYLGKTSK